MEDNPDDVFFVQRTITQARILNPLIVFDTAAAARAHLQESQETRPVVVLLDLDLPGGESGLDLLLWLRRQSSALAEVPAIILTGSIRAEDRDETMALGAREYLQKPVTEEGLQAALQTLGFMIVTRVMSGELARLIEAR